MHKAFSKRDRVGYDAKSAPFTGATIKEEALHGIAPQTRRITGILVPASNPENALTHHVEDGVLHAA